MTATLRIDVVGIGNAIVDVLSRSDGTFLDSQGLTKGTMALVDEQQAEALGAMGPGVETSGGSVANTMAAIAQLGGGAGFIGRVRNTNWAASLPTICVPPAASLTPLRCRAARRQLAA